MKARPSRSTLSSLAEPAVAHGSRMSWAGILRPGNEFSAAFRSQLAVTTSESGVPLKRYFGKWNSPYSRYTTNLSSSKIRVVVLQAEKEIVDPETLVVSLLGVESRKRMGLS